MSAIALGVVMFWFGVVAPLHAAKFTCSSGDVTCLIAAINKANGRPGKHTINLEPGIYTLQITDNNTDGPNGLPSIRRTIRIQATTDDSPTVIGRDASSQSFRIFHISLSGQLTLDGVTVARGVVVGQTGGAAILNRGVTSLQYSVVTNADAFANGTVYNLGTLSVFRTLIADNFSIFDGGGIRNEGNAHVEHSTITHNRSDGGGGIENTGSLVVKNSAIIFNSTDIAQAGGGINNIGGSLQIVNSTIANNFAGLFGGGAGLANFNGQVSITNSTIRLNRLLVSASAGGGIRNFGGSVQIQNTIVAGNISPTSGGSPGTGLGPDCFGTITSLGNNLVGDIIDCDIKLQPSDLTGDPGLGSLVGAGEDDAPGGAHFPVLAGSAVIDKGNPSACLPNDQIGHLRDGTCDIGAVEFGGLVAINIWPKKDANRINPNSNKDINVAILSGNGFDAITVDATTVLFGRTGIEASPAEVVLKDVNRDGLVDLLLSFDADRTGIQCGDTQAVLTGETNAGQPVRGFDSIRVGGCKKQAPR